MTDPKNNTTTWNRDVQGRVTSKVFADGSVIRYSYDAITGRLAKVTDAKGQVTAHQYFPDGNLRQTAYSGGSTPTPPVTFAYDPNTNRLTSFTDGTGTTRYSYLPAGAPGALHVASLTGPRSDKTDYAYDELGAVVSRTIDGVPVNLSYDSLGRVVNETNPLGGFAYSYVDATRRLQSVNYPSGQASQYSYFDNAGDNRLRQILHQDPSQNLLSQFDHTYAATGEITSLTRQAPELSNSPNAYHFNYDSSSQLTAAAPTSSDGTALASYSYRYDPAGNRSLDQSMTFNNLNQMSGFRYDKNGNLLSDGSRTFEWDGVDRLTAIIAGAHRSEFSYDGLGRRVRITEKDNGKVVSDKQLLWCGSQICEERSMAGASTGVTRRFFSAGETQIVGGVESPYYYTRDHLGSIRQMTDSSGAVVASYDYDSWGRATKLSGSIEAAFGYASYYVHAPSGLYLTQYRAYDPKLGRWLSRDPIAEEGGLNLYAYVTNDPISTRDSSGLKSNNDNPPETPRTPQKLEDGNDWFGTTVNWIWNAPGQASKFMESLGKTVQQNLESSIQNIQNISDQWRNTLCPVQRSRSFIGPDRWQKPAPPDGVTDLRDPNTQGQLQLEDSQGQKVYRPSVDAQGNF